MRGSEAVWAVAVLQPTTATEVAALFNDPPEYAGSQLRRAWRERLLVRRERPASGSGRAAYEYRLRVPETGADAESIPTDVADAEVDPEGETTA